MIKNNIQFISNGNVIDYISKPIEHTLTWKRKLISITHIDEENNMQNKIMNAYKQAMLNKDEDRKRVINTLRAKIKNKEIELRTSQKELTDGDILSIVQKLIKQNKDAIQMFSNGGRQDLVEKNELEIKILEEFLPTQLSTDEVDNIIKQEIEKNGYNSMKDMGKLMGYFKSNYSGQVDMGYVSKKIKEMLS